jgi:hypothetical protein
MFLVRVVFIKLCFKNSRIRILLLSPMSVAAVSTCTSYVTWLLACMYLFTGVRAFKVIVVFVILD